MLCRIVVRAAARRAGGPLPELISFAAPWRARLAPARERRDRLGSQAPAGSRACARRSAADRSGCAGGAVDARPAAAGVLAVGRPAGGSRAARPTARCGSSKRSPAGSPARRADRAARSVRESSAAVTRAGSPRSPESASARWSTRPWFVASRGSASQASRPKHGRSLPSAPHRRSVTNSLASSLVSKRS